MRPLHFIVNPGSGGGRGQWLLSALRARGETACSIVGADLIALACVAAAHGAALVACGGDGSSAAVLDAAWRARPDSPVPVGVLPLGTGNDLARVLGWPTAPVSEATLGERLAALRAAGSRALDRWTVSHRGNSRAFVNYCSWGFDARIARRFHVARAQHRRLFCARWVNLAAYGMIAAGEAAALTPVRVEMPSAVNVPPRTAAVVFASIPSYAAGVRLSAGIRADDGLLDAFALPGGVAMGLIIARLRPARLLGRSAGARVHLPWPMAMQVDGEALIAPAGEHVLAHGGQVQALAATE